MDGPNFIISLNLNQINQFVSPVNQSGECEVVVTGLDPCTLTSGLCAMISYGAAGQQPNQMNMFKRLDSKEINPHFIYSALLYFQNTCLSV